MRRAEQLLAIVSMAAGTSYLTFLAARDARLQLRIRANRRRTEAYNDGYSMAEGTWRRAYEKCERELTERERELAGVKRELDRWVNATPPA